MGGERFTPQYVTIVALANYLGKVSQIPDDIARGHTKADIIRYIRISLVGDVGEQGGLGEQEGLEAGAANDLMKATHYVPLQVELFGIEVAAEGEVSLCETVAQRKEEKLSIDELLSLSEQNLHISLHQWYT